MVSEWERGKAKTYINAGNVGPNDIGFGNMITLDLVVRVRLAVTTTKETLRLVTYLTWVIMPTVRDTAVSARIAGTSTVRTTRPSPIRDLRTGIVRVGVKGVAVVLGLGRNCGKNTRKTLGIDLQFAGIAIRTIKGASSITLLLNDAADISTSADADSPRVGDAGEIGTFVVSGVGLESRSLLVAGARNLAAVVEDARLIVGAAGALVLSEGGGAAVPHVGIGVISAFDFGSCLGDGDLNVDRVVRLGELGVLVPVGITLSAGGANHGGMSIDAQVAGNGGFGRGVLVVAVNDAMVQFGVLGRCQ